jgi:hypothetical protein
MFEGEETNVSRSISVLVVCEEIHSPSKLPIIRILHEGVSYSSRGSKPRHQMEPACLPTFVKIAISAGLKNEQATTQRNVT